MNQEVKEPVNKLAEALKSIKREKIKIAEEEKRIKARKAIVEKKIEATLETMQAQGVEGMIVDVDGQLFNSFPSGRMYGRMMNADGFEKWCDKEKIDPRVAMSYAPAKIKTLYEDALLDEDSPMPDGIEVFRKETISFRKK